MSELGRYVVLNPVRAGMVAEAGDWPWSSYRAMIGTVEPPPCLETDWLLGKFGQSREAAHVRYKDFVRAGVGQPPIWEQSRHQLFLGSDAFIQQVTDRLSPFPADLRDVKPAHRRALAKPLAHYETACVDRREAMARAYLSGGYTLREVASHFAVHFATVSRAVRWFEKQTTPSNQSERSKT